MPNANSINYFSPAKWVVSTILGEGTHTTISAAIASASAGDTIVVMPGTYSNALTLKNGVNIVAYQSDSYNGNVTITGAVSITGTVANTLTISGIKFQTTSGNTFTLGNGSAITILNLFNCNFVKSASGSIFSLPVTVNTATTFNVYNCIGDLATTSTTIYSISSICNLNIYNSYFTNSGGSTSNNSSSGVVNLNNCTIRNGVTVGVTGTFNAKYCEFTTSSTISTNISVGITPNNVNISYCSITAAGNTDVITIASPAVVRISNCLLTSSNPTSIMSGSGSVIYSCLTFGGTANNIIVTTQTGSGTLIGSKTTAPSAGFLGEQIVSSVSSGSAISLTSATPANVTSISLTAGIWSVSGIVQFAGTPVISGVQQISISNTSATHGTVGDNSSQSPWATSNFTTGTCPVTIPSYVFVLTTTTTIYLVASGTFSGGTMTAYGRINGIRIG